MKKHKAPQTELGFEQEPFKLVQETTEDGQAIEAKAEAKALAAAEAEKRQPELLPARAQ